MKLMNQAKKIASQANSAVTKAAVAGTALVATSTWAGPMAEAVKTETTDVKTDLYAVGAIVIGFVIVSVIVGATIGMLRRAR